MELPFSVLNIKYNINIKSHLEVFNDIYERERVGTLQSQIVQSKWS
jgi:hypothetical protein